MEAEFWRIFTPYQDFRKFILYITELLKGFDWERTLVVM